MAKRRVIHPGEIVEALFLKDDKSNDIKTAEEFAEEMRDPSLLPLIRCETLPTPEQVQIFREKTLTSQKFWDGLIKKAKAQN